MHFTPHSFVTLMSAHHEISRDSIVQTQIIHSLMKTYWERVLVHKILWNIQLDDELVSYVHLLKEAWLLHISALWQIIRIMKSHTWILNTDITISNWVIQYTSDSNCDYEVHQSSNPWVRSTYKTSTYKRTLKTDLQKLL